jgi:hypothetical protein
MDADVKDHASGTLPEAIQSSQAAHAVSAAALTEVT